MSPTLPSESALDLFAALYRDRAINDQPALLLFAEELGLEPEKLASSARELEQAGFVYLWRTDNPYTWAASVYEHAFDIAERLSDIPGYLPRPLRRLFPVRLSPLAQ